VSLSARDRKIVFAIVPILIIVVYWFLILGPKRQDATTADAAVTKQEQRRDAAQSAASQAASAKGAFASDYTEVVRLGKAIPSAVDMPGLLVQLDKASDGTGIRFTKLTTGERVDAGGTPATPTPSTSGSASSTGTPAAAGGDKAQSGPGTAAESANNAGAKTDQTNAKTDKASGGSGAPATAPAAVGSAAVTPPAGLETVPLTLEFEGNFFNLADFFHRLKRLVRVENDNVVVSGRLVTIESVKYSSDPAVFPKLKAELSATVYLAPLEQGAAAGATAQGPATTPAGATPSTPTPAPTAPAATATP
jgi:Tfp pilus assembly protein PilO